MDQRMMYRDQSQANQQYPDTGSGRLVLRDGGVIRWLPGPHFGKISLSWGQRQACHRAKINLSVCARHPHIINSLLRPNTCSSIIIVSSTTTGNGVTNRLTVNNYVIVIAQ
jgi:hypothetical protein